MVGVLERSSGFSLASQFWNGLSEVETFGAEVDAVALVLGAEVDTARGAVVAGRAVLTDGADLAPALTLGLEVVPEPTLGLDVVGDVPGELEEFPVGMLLGMGAATFLNTLGVSFGLC